MVKTYIENEVVPHIPEEYSEERLHEKFVKRENELWKEIENNLEYYNRLRKTKEDTGASKYGSKYISDEEMKDELKNIRTQTENQRKEADSIHAENKLLKKYGEAFARLYYVKDEYEKKGYDEKLSFTEVDITGNGDIITDNQHYGMSFNPEGKLTQPALLVKTEDDVVFNVGMMEFNKPNSAPEVKLQISFEEEVTESMDADKLNAIFDFCERCGISSSDMIVRRFDGTIDDGAIQEKLQALLAEREAKKAELEAKADKEEFEEQKSREDELVKDIEDLVNEEGGELPKGLSLEETIEEANKVLPENKKLNEEDISADSPFEEVLLTNGTDTLPTVKTSFKDIHLKGLAPKANVFDEDGDRSEKIAKTEDIMQSVASDEGKQPIAQVRQKGVSDEVRQEPFSEQINQEVKADNYAQAAASVAVPQQPKAPASKKVSQAKAEEMFEKFFEEGLTKRRNYSYFKTHTGLFGKGWTEYIIYDSEDRKNYRNDAREDKNGNVKYNYSFKFFVKQDSNGNMHFAYRTPHHKPLNEDIAGGIAGQFKDLGFTHINFPKGVPDKEKGVWRKVLAEKGIVPVGMGLDRSKAEGMIKAAKEKLSSEEFSKFKYRLAMQMKKHNEAKGKKIDKSERDFIEGLLLARKYEAFSSGYTEVLKGKITRLIHPEEEKENGAVVKIAAMGNLRRLFNVFKDGVESGTILNSKVLTAAERKIISENYPGLLINPSKFTSDQFAELYNVMFKESCDVAKIELEKRFREPGAKRAHEAIKQGEFNAAYNSCKSIIKELKALGVDEIDLPETTNKLPYNAPDLSQNKSEPSKANTNKANTGKENTNKGTNPTPTPSSAAMAAAHTFER